MTSIRQLRDTDPFSLLTDAAFAEIQSAVLTKRFAASESIFNQFDPPTGYLYVIRKGLVEITVQSPGGVEMVVDYRREGDFFGGTPVFSNETYTGGARTAQDTECYLIPAEVMRAVADRHPEVSRHFTRIALSRVRHLYADIVTEHSKTALGQMEAYPFKKRLSEIMSTPVESCRSDEPVRQVARRMAEKGISCVVVLDDYNSLLGLITESDLVTKVIAAEGVNCDDLTAWDVLDQNIDGMPPQTYMYEAMAYMVGHKTKYMPVIDRGEVVGMVTMRDLMMYRSQKAMLVVGSVQEAKSLDTLAESRARIVDVAKALLSESRTTPEVLEILSYIHHSIQRRAYDLVYADMLREGYRLPKVRFAFLIMGSGGRREMLLNPDQDNGFIFENYPAEKHEEVEAFFVPFAERLVDAFHRIGYPLCTGKVMATNPAWRGTLNDWMRRIHGWVNDPEPQSVRYSSIFFDFVPLAGDGDLASTLRRVVYREIRDFPAFLYHMMNLDLKYKVPLGMLGRFLVEKSGPHKGELSLKQGGTVYVVDCIRMFALERELTEMSSLNRLKKLVEKNVFSAETAEHIRAAFEALTFLRLRNEIQQVERGEEPGHYIDPHALSKTEQDLLKEAFAAVSKLQDATKRHFARTPF